MSEPRTTTTSPIVVVIAVACLATVGAALWWALGTNPSAPGSSGSDDREAARSQGAATNDLHAGAGDFVDAIQQVRSEPQSTGQGAIVEESSRRVTARVPVPDPPPEPMVEADAVEPAVFDPPVTPEVAAQRVADTETLAGNLKGLELGALTEDQAIAELEAYISDAEAAAGDLIGALHYDARIEVRGYVALARTYELLELRTAEQIALSNRDDVTQRLTGGYGETALSLYELAVRNADTGGVEVPGLDDARAFLAERDANVSIVADEPTAP